MKKLLASLVVMAAFVGFGITSLNASVIKDGIVLASNDKCGGSKCGASTKCGGEKEEKKYGEGKCGEEKKSSKCGSSKCGSSDKCGGEKKDKPVKSSCGTGKCGS
ncbi:MAG: hypothetical protein K8R39_09990 [Arcobacteraceae bacterium]|nr:hypothetical protein [Arcobacteraceae bacterium]